MNILTSLAIIGTALSNAPAASGGTQGDQVQCIRRVTINEQGETQQYLHCAVTYTDTGAAVIHPGAVTARSNQ